MLGPRASQKVKPALEEGKRWKKEKSGREKGKTGKKGKSERDEEKRGKLNQKESAVKVTRTFPHVGQKLLRQRFVT